ncbi:MULTISPECIES: NAD-dependent succinate-semialdehyde dehydrogenase [Pseudomonas]|uniref:NAD-dependent succinate-semialdehyde dehydrogenase n=1 Tax=Pseudomonas nitroreducens TaxID=46680 RepID=A0A6G6IW31_PSENT|nr:MULTISPECIES: NAD-dependent succinate-semialdehyde dehydrogenase [Pseudomonas]MCJ1877719.1 NAD-dependent succinate-semialdehyde dehydrogenase [Pseudomonas nitroreducens]MCJ1897133.1 NAD-dependent succinate-semialdehyde dehydrogenase [Pseudomonas nitroreducens]MDG9857620.1 NAD-dependent succinate-semialdehyde dehydrogenase [Pseudomonas nitroreducens]MDH1076737.1 NAD-dependent succinate-semialdehyde dehydrogenase [Pseudomonas nitroreducens]NMZ62305.1 NAD-dependent succinate-semialdehyde dehyd
MNQIAAIPAAISRSPATGQELARYTFEDAAQLETALARTDAAFRQWRDTGIAERVAVLRKMAEVLRANVEPMARMEAQEMGMPVTQARGEINKCANLCEWYADNGPAMLEDEKTSIDGAYISYLPLGPVLAVMPWNFPTWQVMRGAVSIILGGNTYVLKHAPNVMGCAYQLRDAWLQAGLPEGVFEVLNVEPPLVSKAIADDRIASIAVTGSVGAGAAIASQAGAALKKCVLELGGSDAFIVLADADLDAAVKAAVASRFGNCGQVCIAAKRMILEESIAPAFTEKLLAAVKALKIGDPLADDTFVGPMARFDLRDELDGQVQQAIADGATLLLGGHKLDGEGNYYAPTVLANVQPGNTAFKKEIFGPVASLIVARDAEHALELANDSEFGLSGAIWTADKAKAQHMARRLVSGGVFINGFSASDPRVPIGGVKKSGFGRELSHFGLREFTNPQTVWIDRK